MFGIRIVDKEGARAFVEITAQALAVIPTAILALERIGAALEDRNKVEREKLEFEKKRQGWS